MNAKLKVGVFGIKRGASFAAQFEKNSHTQLTAICDYDDLAVRTFLKGRTDINVYRDFDLFLNSGVDIVVLCNYATEHVSFGIKALRAGKHVLSEVFACKTLAEGVALCRAVEQSGKTYMLGENYCYFKYVQEMTRLYQKGMLGEYLYGECEYVHDCRMIQHSITSGPDHWRNWIPPMYYCTHSLGPIITITKTRPVKVSGFVVPNTLSRQVERRGDDWGILVCTMDNNAVTRVLTWSTGPHDSIWYRVHGTKGAMENNRWRDTDKLNLYIEKWPKPGSYEKTYEPEFHKYARQAKKTGHGGGDFFIVWDFVDAIIKGKNPPIDVYMAMDMTLPGLLGYRSACQGNAPLEVPDFRSESVRKKYEKDHWSPDPKDKGLGRQPAPSVLGRIKIPAVVHQQMARKRRQLELEMEKKVRKYRR